MRAATIGIATIAVTSAARTKVRIIAIIKNMFVISNKVTKATVRRGQRTEVADLPQLNVDAGPRG